MQGVPLDRAEQSFYDAVVDLDEKETYVRQEVHRMVDGGQITKYEREMMLEQNAERIASLKSEGRSTAKAVERREMLEHIDPQPPHRLRHEAAIVKLHRELAPLVRMEDAARGRLLSVRETQTLARKEEIMDEISYLEESSQGWFEDDDVFEFRLQAARARYVGRSKTKGSGGGGGGGGGARVTANAASLGKIRAPAAATSRWVTPGSSSQGWGKAGGAGGKKKKKGKGGAVFAAMMMNSDSDDEDEDESVDGNNEEEEEEEKVDVSASNKDEGATPVASAKKKSRNKKKKKKKKGGGSGGGQGHEISAEEDRALEVAVAQNAKDEDDSEKDEEQTAVARVFSFVATYIIPLIVAVLTWIFGLIFGKPKKSKKKSR